jgi:glucosamine--fructose-6-phosphate aminotransferase (isomerizing)
MNAQAPLTKGTTMCGIIGYVGPQQATSILIDGLKRLEYRGYDSAGVAVHDQKQFSIVRAVGKLTNLEKKLKDAPPKGCVGLAHSRWATHGRPSEENAHPHQAGDVVVIHNGIIENHLELKAELLEKGRVFSSETDTEICAHLIDEEMRSGKQPLDAVRASLARVRGAYALVIAFQSYPEMLIAAKTASPMVLGLGDGENFVASDVPALLPYTRNVIYLDEGEIAVITKEKVSIENARGEAVQRAPKHITWSSVMAEKDGYKHFMLKEIFEQPRAITDTLRGRISLETGDVILGEDFLPIEKINKLRRIVIVACGTSWHAGLVGKYLIESMAKVPVEVDLASEFRYRDPLVGADDLVLAISQSGETADTLAAIMEAKRRGASIVSICNVVDSSIPRASDAVLYTHAGPEIGVASTKAFTTQMAALYLFGVYLGRRRNALSADVARGYLQSLTFVPQWIEELLKQAPACLEIARIISHCQDALYLGRGLQVAIALEGALKLKEISYVHAEGYPGGEMKHGPIALITNTMPIIAMATKHESYEKMLSNLQEVRAREGRLFSIATQGDTALEKLSEKVIYIPVAERVVEPFLTVIPMQLIAYYTADLKGTDVDQPRNLAKSVTVE